MTFTRPKSGPKAYLSRGPSGHVETFDRAGADRDLEHYLGSKSKVTIAIEGFVRKMSLDRRVEDWSDVIAYLGEMTKLGADLVPLNVAVAFWATVIAERENVRNARLAQLATGN
jgi:hypothetical protein